MQKMLVFVRNVQINESAPFLQEILCMKFIYYYFVNLNLCSIKEYRILNTLTAVVRFILDMCKNQFK